MTHTPLLSASRSPAWPVVASTALTGTGLGLLAWLGLSLFLIHTRADLMPTLQSLQLWTLTLGGLLTLAGQALALLPPGQPHGPWRTRERTLALTTLAPALVLVALLLLVASGPERAIAIGACGLLLAVLALSSVAAAAMVYASQARMRVWQHKLVIPVFLLFALLTGLALLFWLMHVRLPFARGESGTLLTLGVLGAVLAICKVVYWYRIDRLPPTEDPPLSGRTHVTVLRWVILALLLPLPLLAWWLARTGMLPPGGLLAATATGLLCAAFAERWLFFAEAGHPAASA